MLKTRRSNNKRIKTHVYCRQWLNNTKIILLVKIYTINLVNFILNIGDKESLVWQNQTVKKKTGSRLYFAPILLEINEIWQEMMIVARNLPNHPFCRFIQRVRIHKTPILYGTYLFDWKAMYINDDQCTWLWYSDRNLKMKRCHSFISIYACNI